MSRYSTSATKDGSTQVAFGFLIGLERLDLGLTTVSSCLRIWLEMVRVQPVSTRLCHAASPSSIRPSHLKNDLPSRRSACARKQKTFFTQDHRADLTVQSIPNPANDSPATFLAKRRPPAGIQYRRVTPRFFAVSSIRNGRTWYNRCNRTNEYMHCVMINYPAAEERQWDEVVTRISLSLAN